MTPVPALRKAPPEKARAGPLWKVPNRGVYEVCNVRGLNDQPPGLAWAHLPAGIEPELVGVHARVGKILA